ncbi:cob(I)yrinic acid a,c-diamide adenosyltransferase [Candidatus Roizmanbacteria bacterium]|nr:MAG: cob(I)yrinic acid a,c-diamide adenosyltransferase [Candidatus Roizmanbacteria bacterium]
MSITTKTGDKGETALFGGKRVKKYDPQVEAYGSVDEATSFIGSAIEAISDKDVTGLLTNVQLTLYILMAHLSGYKMDRNKVEDHLKSIEKEIVRLENTLPKLTRFILPQGSEEASRLQIARAMVRSSERRVTAYVDRKTEQTADDMMAVQYLNRLSDLLFMLARKYTPEEHLT